MNIATIFEILIGIFAGYCCCYFIADKLIGKTPERVMEIFFEMIAEKIKNIWEGD